MPEPVSRRGVGRGFRGPAKGQPRGVEARRLLVSGHPQQDSGDGAASDFGAVDERARVQDVTKPPFRMICSIEVDTGGGNFAAIGTGWLVGRCTVVTAAHVLWWEQKYEKVRVIAGRDHDQHAVGPIESSVLHFHDEWSGNAPDNVTMDVAAIRLPIALGDRIGWFGVSALQDGQLVNRLVNVAGYPQIAQGQDVGCQELWCHAHQVDEVEVNRIYYSVDTSGGQSGAPVMLWPDPLFPTGGPSVVGVHTRGYSIDRNENSATRINAAKLQLLGQWVTQDNGAL